MKNIRLILAVVLATGLMQSCKDHQSMIQPTGNVANAEHATPSAQPSQNVNASGNQTHPEGNVKWLTVDAALDAQKKEARPIMVDVYTQWCGPCKMLAKQTFTDPQVEEYLNAHFYSVRFDGEGNETVNFKGNTYTNPSYDPNLNGGRNSIHQFTQFLNVNAYPTLFFFDDAGNPLGPVAGFRGPKEIEIFLKYFGEGTYKTVKTQEQWSEYEKNFKGSWK